MQRELGSDPRRMPQRADPRACNRFAALDEDEDEELMPVSADGCCGRGHGGPPAARGLRAPRPRGKPRRVLLTGGWRECGRTGARGELSLLLEGSPGGLLAAVGRDPAHGGVRDIEVVVDSGTVQSVAPPGLFPGVVEPSTMSKAGRTYRAANGSRIRNLGQVRVPFVSAEGHKCNFPFQVAEVEHALLSVGHLTAAGNRVELYDKGGTITHIASGKTMALTHRGGVYVLRLRVSGFPRPVAK